jgi:hypothetical protein
VATDEGFSKVAPTLRGVRTIGHARAALAAQPFGPFQGLGLRKVIQGAHPMRRLALIAVPLLALTAPLAPAVAADLDEPVYRERKVVIERPAAPVVRERIIERNYYYEAEPAPPVHAYVQTYSYAPAYAYAPAFDAYAPRAYRGYAYDDGYRWHRRRAFFVDRPYRGHHHPYWRY